MQNRSTPPIIQAAKDGNIEEVQRLLNEHPEEVNQMNVLGLTALHFAVAEGHIATVDLLLSRGAAVNPGNDGESSRYMNIPLEFSSYFNKIFCKF
jgi:ankyrin repeat protein